MNLTVKEYERQVLCHVSIDHDKKRKVKLTKPKKPYCSNHIVLVILILLLLTTEPLPYVSRLDIAKVSSPLYGILRCRRHLFQR